MADHAREVDAVSGVETTGHEWDGLKELNNPLPRWWLWVFYATIVWSVIYWILMPSWPLVTGYTHGLLGASQRQQATAAYDAAMAVRAKEGATLATASLEEIEKTPQLLAFAEAQGKAAFGDNCAPCHGSGATGSVGYPSLQDDDWLWGGSLEAIDHTITVGIRSTSDDTRVGDMMAFGRDGILDKAQIANVVGYVRTLSGLAPDAGADVAAGKTVFAENCAACHGADGKGNQELGAPNLTDGIWLYGDTTAAITQTVTDGRRGVMPTWGGRLDPVTIKSLAIYVHSLGGGT